MLSLARSFKRGRAEDGEESVKIQKIFEVYELRKPLLIVGCLALFENGSGEVCDGRDR